MTAVLLGMVMVGGRANPQNRPAAQARHSLQTIKKKRKEKKTREKELSHGYQPKNDDVFPSMMST